MKEPKRWIERLLVVPNTKRKQSKSFLRLIAPSILSIFLCAICLVGLTWAWFIDQDTCKVGTIQTSQFTVNVEISKNAGSGGITKNLDGSYTLQSGSQYTVALTTTGTASTGYCAVTLGTETYYTTQMLRNQTLTFTINCTHAASEVTMSVTPNWMTYSGYSEDATDLLGKDLTAIVIGTAPPESEETQPNETEMEQMTEPEQTSTAETEETDQPSEAPSDVESPESPDLSGADAFTEPIPEGGETSPTEGDAAPPQEQEVESQPENPEGSPSEP